MNVLFQRSVRLQMWLTAALLSCGCAPQALPAGQHSPTNPAQVKIYQKQPAKYEKLGAISVPVTPEMTWDKRGDSTPGFEALKAKAAGMGANGVLLVKEPGEYDMVATVGYKGEFYQVPMRAQPKTALAEAIYVVKE